MKKISFFLSFFIAMSVSTAQDDLLPLFITDNLDNYIIKGIEEWKVPGLAIAIVKDGQPVFMKGYGVSSIESKKPVTEHTLFQIGSITKSFTATTAAILSQEKEFSLNDKVTKWIPYFELKDPLISREVIVTDLLAHRLGLNSYSGDLIYYLSDFSREEVVKKMAMLDIEKRFRASYGYSNSAYTAVGKIIEQVNAKSWEETVREKILDPLQMDRTIMTLHEKHKLSDISKPHTIIDEEIKQVDYSPMDYTAPASSMLSSVNDLSNWLIAQLQDGQFNGKQVISRRAIRRTRNPYGFQGFNQRNHARTHFYAYGLGYFIRDINGLLSYQHSGGITGFSSNHIIIPEKELAIVILTNTDCNDFYTDLMNVIVDAFLELPFQDYSFYSLKDYEASSLLFKNEIDSLKSLAKKQLQPSTSLQNFLGYYENEAYGEILISQVAGRLKLTLSNQEEIVGMLDYLGDNQFLCTFSQYEFGVITIPFQLEGESVIGFELLLENMESNSYEFIKKN